jgi:bifunctional non-homologous end joining protein LigD
MTPALDLSGGDLMKAVLTDAPFDEPGWIFERKFDGIRCLAIKDGGGVRLLSRNDLDLRERFPTIAEAVAELDADDFALDGEVVAVRGGFAGLAHPGGRAYFVFDALEMAGEDLRELPLTERKQRLHEVGLEAPLHPSEPLKGNGLTLFKRACRNGWEGLIAKREDSTYAARRSRDWLKVKCGSEQELVIGGFTEPRGSRTGFGALLLGYYRDGALVYAGKVGTGFNRALLEELALRLQALRQDSPPFAEGDPPHLRVTWVRPELVAQVAFSEWTADGRLRHPRFLGLRDDKPAREVVREGA